MHIRHSGEANPQWLETSGFVAFIGTTAGPCAREDTADGMGREFIAEAFAILGAIAALADVAGGLVLVRARGVERYLRYFVALGAGF